MRICLSLPLLFCTYLSSYAQADLERRLGRSAWVSGKKEMVFEWTGRAVAVRDFSLGLSGMQSIHSSKKAGRDAWVFRRGNRYFGLAFLDAKRLLTSETADEGQAASNILSRNSSSKTWGLALNSLKNGLSPEACLADTVWHSGSEEMVFSSAGNSYIVQPIFPLQKDFQGLILKRTLNEDAWVFLKGSEYFGVRLSKDLRMITVQGPSLDMVSEGLTAAPPPAFRHTEWQPRP